MMDKQVRIFVSSTWQDLQPERKAVEEALLRMQNTTFKGMEYFGSRTETPKEVSLTEVGQGDIYIGIFAHRYGSGITEAEYRRAQERGIPCLIYLKDENVPVLPSHLESEPDKVARLDALKRELKSHHIVSFFKNPDQLATQVVADLHNFFGSAPSLREEKPIQPGSKYQISITDSQGVVIGDQSNVTQRFIGTKLSQLMYRIIQVKGEHRVYLIDQDGFRHWIPDGPTFETLARWNDVELLASWEELESFPPEQPLPSIVFGIKPWLVKVRGEKEIFLIDKTGVRHRLRDMDLDRSIDERTEVDVLASWTELERFQPGQPLSNIELDKASETSIHSSISFSKAVDIRIQHLADNLSQDLSLLKDYEDALRYEDDPRRRMKYRREIEQIRASAAHYQKEYDELRMRVSGTPPVDMQDIANQLEQMDNKLNILLRGQSAIRTDLNELRQAVLIHYDSSVQNIVATILERLDHNQLATVQEILVAIEGAHIPDTELRDTHAMVRQSLSELGMRGANLRDRALARELIRISEVINEPKMDMRHKLKITVPIIPVLLAYEGELEIRSGMELETVWKRLVGKVRGD